MGWGEGGWEGQKSQFPSAPKERAITRLLSLILVSFANNIQTKLQRRNSSITPEETKFCLLCLYLLGKLSCILPVWLRVCKLIIIWRPFRRGRRMACGREGRGSVTTRRMGRTWQASLQSVVDRICGSVPNFVRNILDKSRVVWRHCCVKAASSSLESPGPIGRPLLPCPFLTCKLHREGVKWLKGRKWLRLLWKLSGTDLTGGQAGGWTAAVINGGEKLNSHCNQTADDTTATWIAHKPRWFLVCKASKIEDLCCLIQAKLAY